MGNRISVVRVTKKNISSASTQDEVDAALRVDNVTDLPNAQRKRSLFERLLHLPMTKPAQVAIVIMR